MSSHNLSSGEDRNSSKGQANEINRANILSHEVHPINEENIKDFLSFEVQPRGTNLTIGLKRLISIAKAFMEEPNFLVLEENALEFDELGDHFFFDVFKVKNLFFHDFLKNSKLIFSGIEIDRSPHYGIYGVP